MADIFNYGDTVGDKAFKDGDEAALSFGGALSLVQQWNVQYQLNITPILECGSSKVYFAAKHGNGTMTIGRIVAEDPTGILNQVGTVCDQGKSATLIAASGCGGTSAVTLTIQHPMATGIGFSGQAQNAFVSEDLQIMFASLDPANQGPTAP